MKERIKNRILKLRNYMKKHQLDAFIIPTTDPHLSEYTADHWKTREWISGFTGSAGTMVILLNQAGLWTDSRYFLQANTELLGTGIDLYKDGMPNTPTISTFLLTQLSPKSRVGIDGALFSKAEVIAYQTCFNRKSIQLVSTLNPFDILWEGRPPLPQANINIHPLAYAGIPATEKIKNITHFLKEKGADAIFISSLDEIAWTLNLRGEDVHCTPVFISYLLITSTKTTLFIDKKKITKEVKKYLDTLNIEIEEYTKTVNTLKQISVKSTLLSPEQINDKIYSAISSNCSIIESNSPIALAKATKNNTEIKGIHAAMIRDGIALVKFQIWLEKMQKSGTETELSIAKKLRELRSEQALFKDESFDTIAGYQSNAAIVHYTASENHCAKIQGNGLLLIDSGAQYLDATTDITRTIAIGKPSKDEKKDYTLVLKGHLNLSHSKFPKGTRGTQLDILARQALWEEGYNYFHGTGHGVGSYLAVHEGPQSIRMNENPVPLELGMLISNEPGLYQANRHGIRIENLVLVTPYKQTEYGEFYQFETVTLCPIDTKPILKEMLTTQEKEILNKYHNKVYKLLSPQLNETEKEWLKEKTKSI